MLEVQSTLDFLQDLPIYQTERPYVFTYPGGVTIDENHPALNTVRLVHVPVTLRDIRYAKDYSLSTSGFEKANHTSQVDLDQIQDGEVREAYRLETSDFLKQHLGAENVHTYNVKTRKNVIFDPDEKVNLLDRVAPEPAALGVHDLTFDQAAPLISDRLPAETLEKYMKPGYRFRIVNTWRPLLPVIEDRPLAFCDSRTVDPRDLVVADRIFPHQEFELYFLKHNPKQSWHWLSNHNRSELIIMLMYDTQPGGARFCPHGSFDNPLARNSAPPRQSVETRSVVVTRE
jgi:hypothetical protein